MLKYPSMPDNSREKILERKKERKKKDAEEVSNLPSIDPDESDGHRPSKKQPFYSLSLSQGGHRLRYFNDGTRPRFWEVWNPDAPQPDAIEPTSRPRLSTITRSSIISTLRAPVVVQISHEDSSSKDMNPDDIIMKVIPPPPISPSRSRTPVDNATAEFPSRRAPSMDIRFRFAPKLIFPQDVEDYASFSSETYMIGEDFEEGEHKVTEYEPETLDGKRHFSRGSLISMGQNPVASETEETDIYTNERRASLARRGSGRKGSDEKDVSFGTPTQASSTLPKYVSKKLVKRKIVRVPPISQEQWIKIHHAYDKLNPRPPRICPTSFYARSPQDIKYPVTLPDAFQLLEEIQSVERLPDLSDELKGDSSVPTKNYSPKFLLEMITSDDDFESKSRKAPTVRSGSISGRRRSSVLYYVEPPIKRESLDDLPQDEGNGTIPPEFEIVTTINEKTKQVFTYMERKKSIV